MFTFDLRRAVETANIAFAKTDVPILHNWRLRGCRYGTGNGMLAVELHQDRAAHVTDRYPGGESLSDAVQRLAWFLRELHLAHDQGRVLVIGHFANRWGLQHHLNERSLADLMAEGYGWQVGWEYRLNTDHFA